MTERSDAPLERRYKHRWMGPYHDRLEFIGPDGKRLSIEQIENLLNASVVSETGRTYEDGLEKAAAHVEAVAKSLSKGFERERDALELTASAIRYLKNAAPQVVSSSKATVPAQEAMAHGETGGPAESASPCVAVPILTPTRDDGSAAPHGE